MVRHETLGRSLALREVESEIKDYLDRLSGVIVLVIAVHISL